MEAGCAREEWEIEQGVFRERGDGKDESIVNPTDDEVGHREVVVSGHVLECCRDQ